MTEFDPLDLSSTPAGAPLVPLLPIRLRRTEILTVVYRTARGAAGALVPRPLELASDLCVLHVYHMHDAEWFGDYCESAWQLPVMLPDGTPAVYSPFLVLESDGAVAAGREAYGQPKKAGQVCLERPRGTCWSAPSRGTASTWRPRQCAGSSGPAAAANWTGSYPEPG